VKNKVAIIFGSSGQDSFYLNAILQQQNVVAINISRKSSDVIGDVGDYKFVGDIIKQHQPDFIFHLAANSTVQHNALFENHKTICDGTLNILENTRLFCPSAKIFLSGSALQFRNEGLPINEKTPFEGESPYAVARIQSVYAARYYRKAFGLKIYVGYFFNHDSRFRTEQHVNQKIAKAAKRISLGSKEKLVLGNIEVQKEFNFAGDVVQAIWILMNQENVFEAVIGSGKAYRILDWLAYCFDSMDLKWEDAVILQDNYVPQYQILVSDPGLIMSLGWHPVTDIYQLANMMLNDE
jgi:GDPmannose 4,6-dehydratase